MTEKNTALTRRLHIAGLTPSISEDDLRQRLGTFGVVKSIDGFGNLDGVGVPRKFAFATLEGNRERLARCTALSGATWKGAKLRIGEARPDFRERIQQENDPSTDDKDKSRLKRRQCASGVQSADMNPVSLSDFAIRSGWRLEDNQRIMKRMRMRPEHPLPVKIEVSRNALPARKKKSKKTIRPALRHARRVTIDPVSFGSSYLRFDVVNDGGHNQEMHTLKSVESSSSRGAVEDRDLESQLSQSQPGNEVSAEINRDLGLLHTIFANEEDWDAPHSISSIEEVSRDASTEESPNATRNDPLSEAPQQAHRTNDVGLKNVFAPLPEEAGSGTLFSNLVLDLELDLEPEHDVTPLVDSSRATQAPSQSLRPPTVHISESQCRVEFNPIRPLFFLIPESDRRYGKARDFRDVAREHDWTAFHKTQTDDEIRAEWDSQKTGLTRDWKERHRESMKLRKRRRDNID